MPPREEEITPQFPDLVDKELRGAFADLKKGNIEDALSVFQAYEDENELARFGAAVSLYRLKKYDDAVYRFETLREEPSFAFPSLKLLAFSEYYLNRLEESNEYARMALSLKSDQELNDLLKKVKEELQRQEGYISEESGHFIVRFDGHRHGGLSRLVLGFLEDAYRDIGREMDIFPEEPLTVILYTERDFHDITHIPRWAGGVYDGKIRIPVRGAENESETLRRVLYHEYAHTLVLRISKGAIPLWLNEGIAEYFSGDHGVRVGQVIPLASLESSFHKLSGRQVGLAYLESYSAVSYLKDRYGLYYIKDLLERVGEGEPFKDAFFNVFGIEYDTFLNSWGK